MSAQPSLAGAVVVVGSLHYDIMVDAPARPRRGETVAGYRWHPKFGGKGGNQAAAAAKAGVEARMVGAVGDDHFGKFLLEGLDAADVDRRRVAVLPEAGSGMSVAISDEEGDYGAVIVSGSNLSIPEPELDAPGVWEGAKVLLLQNEVPEAINVQAAHRARRAGLVVCLNAAPARPIGQEFLPLINVLIVNAVEAEMLSGVVVRTLDDALQAAVALQGSVRTVVVTAGGAGVAAAADDLRLTLPAIPVKVVSTHGAGDTFVGTFAASIASETSPKDALAKANIAAAAHVKRGDCADISA